MPPTSPLNVQPFDGAVASDQPTLAPLMFSSAATPPAQADTARAGPLSGTRRDSRLSDPIEARSDRLTEIDPGASRAGEVASDAEPTGAARYRVHEELGRGGCGVVHGALDRQFTRDVAVKSLNREKSQDPRFVQRFLHEAKLTGRLEHPGIVPVYEWGRRSTSGEPFFAMKRLSGHTLAQEIAKYHRLGDGSHKTHAFHSLLARFLTVCQTMSYAHDRGVIHRDLKPTNIMVGAYGETIVVDWGLAKELTKEPQEIHPDSGDPMEVADRAASDEWRADATRDGAVMGTPAFMPPEQARGEIDRLDARSDVYSLGVILYHILSGQTPYQGSSVTETLELVRRGVRKGVRERDARIPKPLEAICHHAMAFEPADRYASAGQLAADLERWLAGEPVHVYRESLLARLQRWVRKHPSWSAAVGVGTLVTTVTFMIASVLIGIAHQREQQAKDRESQAKGLALRQLRDARSAADAWFIQLSADLEHVPGLQPVREQLLQQAAEHYERQASVASTDPSLAIEAVRDTLRAADLMRLRGEVNQAAEAFERARVHAERLTTAPGLVPQWECDLERRNAMIGLVLCATELRSLRAGANEQPVNEVSPAVGWLKESLRGNETSRPLADQSGDWLSSLARGYLALGRWAASIDAPEESIGWFEQAGAWADQLPDSTRSRFDPLRATILTEWSRECESQGALERAIEILERLEGLETRRIETTPNRAERHEDRAIARMRLANLLLRDGNDTRAEATYRLADEDLAVAWRILYGEHFFNENLGITQANLGLLAARRGAFEDAATSLTEASRQLTGVISQHGATGERLGRLAEAYAALAQVQSVQGDPACITHYRKADQIFSHLRTHGLISAKEQEAEFQMLEQWATYLAHHKDWDACRAVVDQARQRFETAGHPNSDTWRGRLDRLSDLLNGETAQ